MSGPPFGNAQSDINTHLLDEVSSIKSCIGRIEGDIRVIKTYIESDEKSKDRRFTTKQASFLAGVSAFFGLISAAIMNFFGGS